MAKILLVEDDRVLAKIVKKFLQSHKYVVELTFDGETGLNFIEGSLFDLLIVDWNLPNITGLELCQRYRRVNGKAPVLFLTAKADIESKLLGFSAGADDYLVKPFDTRELLVRVRALLKRTEQTMEEVLQADDLEMNLRSGIVTRSGEPIELTTLEYSLLELLMRHPNELISQDTIIDRVWKADSAATELS
ncbi:MAG: response regulator transcription factor, partial [Cyanobacteria bacterium]|nr:response regulator transcription factor [Cyanobacteriota bacterium]